MQDTVILQEGRERSLLRHHPWVFSKAIYKEDLKYYPLMVIFCVMDCTVLNPKYA